MDLKARNRLSALVNELTTTGLDSLQQPALKDLKAICKQSDANVTATYEVLAQQLKKSHAQIRYSCVQVTGELFKRSATFRQLLVSDFPAFMQLTLGIHGKRLPPPERHAERLKQLTLRYIKSWKDEFGERYKQLGLGYDYLRNSMRINFDQMEFISPEPPRSNRMNLGNEDQRRAVRERQLQLVEEEVCGMGKEIEENVSTLNSFLDLLVRGVDALYKHVTTSGDPALREAVVESELCSSRRKLSTDVSPTEQVPEGNSAVHASLLEAYQLLVGKHTHVISDWMKRIVKIAPQRSEQQNDLVKRIIRLRERTTEAKLKAEELGAGQWESRIEEVGDRDGEFDETAISAAETSRSTKRKRSAATGCVRRIFALQGEEGLDEDVTYRPLAATVAAVGEENDDTKWNEEEVCLPAFEAEAASANNLTPVEGETREDLLKRAPVVTYGQDLDHWDKKTMQFNTTGLEFSHRFWGTSVGDNDVSRETLDRLKKRAVFYRPRPTTKLKECRHPLNDGKLCPRRQETTCPFHGPIVLRDDCGRIQPPDAEGSSNDVDRQDDRRTAGRQDGTRVAYRGYLKQDKEDGSVGKLEGVGDPQVASVRSAPLEKVDKSASGSPRESCGSGSSAGATRKGPEEGVAPALDLAKIPADSGKRRKRGVPASSSSSALVKLSKSKEPKSAIERIERKISSRESRRQLNQTYQRDAQARARNRQANQW